MHKRVFTTALALLLGTCLLTGCGGTPETPGGTTPGGTTPGGETPGGTTPGGTTPGGTTPGGSEEPGVHIHDGTTYLMHGGTCSCGETFPAGDHEWNENNTCTVCGYTLPATEGLVYTDVEGGVKAGYDWESAILIAADTLIIPAYHEGKKVVEVQGYFESDGKTKSETRFAGAEFETVAVPNTVTTVPNFVFYECASLKEAYVGSPLGAGMFQDCTSLKKVALPDTTAVIPQQTFSGCFALHDFDIPSSVTEIGGKAFSKCEALVRLTIPKGLETLGDTNQIFANCCRLVEVYDRSTLGLSARKDLKGNNSNELKGCHVYTDEADAGKFAKKDGYLFYTLDGATSLLYYEGDEKELVLPEKDPDGNNYPVAFGAFQRMGLVSVSTGDGVTKLGRNAFAANKSLLRVEIGKNVSEIVTKAFDGCTRLFEVGNFSAALDIQSGSSDNGGVAEYALHVYTEADSDDHGAVTRSGDYLFFSYGSQNILAYYEGSASELTLPALCNGNKYTIAESFLQGTQTITRVVFGNGVTEIGKNAFLSCTNLSSVEFGNSLEKIGESAFFATDNLTSVSFPASLVYIGKDAFRSYHEGKGLTSATFAVKEGWTYLGSTTPTPVDVSDPADAAQKLAVHDSTGDSNSWQRSAT